MPNIIEIALNLANAALFTALIATKGLLCTAVGLLFELAALILVPKWTKRPLRAVYLTLSATAGIIAGIIAYPSPITPETIAATLLTILFHGGTLLIADNLLQK